MKIEEVRTSFTVYLIASDLQKFSDVAESLRVAGYLVASFSELSPAFSEFYSNPPHFLLVDAQEQKFDLSKAIQQVVAQLPESHVYLLTPIEERKRAVSFLDQGVYDLILLPLASPLELVRGLDRAAERDYFMYMNERLMQEPRELLVAGDEPATGMTTTVALPEDFNLEFARKLFAQTSVDECVKVFMSSVCHALGGISAVHFKYVQNRRVLLAASAEGLDDLDLRGLGLDLNAEAEGFRTVQLREPMRIAPLTEMIKEVFQQKNFFAQPIRALGEIQGVVVFFAAPPAPALNEMLMEWSTLLEKALSLVEAEKRLHVVTTKDPTTDLLNRQTFLTRITEEISRSRRTHLPTSLVLVSVDQYGQLSSHYGQEEAQLILRTAARILEKHSRVNDILGRTGVDEFGLLLAHTDKQGAMIKAERLRMMIESADFSKILNGFGRLTISLGISEYPSLVRDAEELLQSADEALYQVRKAGNKTCVAKAPEGFEPDFRAEVKVEGM